MATEAFVLPVVDVNVLDEDGPQVWKNRGAAFGGVILRNALGEPTHDRVLALASALGEPRNSVVGLDRAGTDFVHDIKPQEVGLRDKRGQVIRSTTFQATPLHTDGYNAEPPPRLMILQVVHPGLGGETTASSVAAVVAGLSSNAIELLSRADYPVASGTTPILRFEDERWKMRCNLYEVHSFLAAKEHDLSITSDHLNALSELAEVLDYQEGLESAHASLLAGDVLVVDNEATLHGRRALAESDSGRLLHRVWCS